MQLKDFYFDLPKNLIAHYPTLERSTSRLLTLDNQAGEIAHRRFFELVELLSPGDLLVFNNTKVIPARLFGHKASGGKIEILLERILDTQRALVHIRASKAPKPGARLVLEKGTQVKVIQRHHALFEIEFLDPRPLLGILEAEGHIPLPPYIERHDEATDKDRYQTVYAQHSGAVAAPTAGLHFDKKLLAALTAKAINSAYVTLHVGAGTFQPVRVADIREHKMHCEYMELSSEVCELVQQTKARGNAVIAVGTTSVRCLETAARQGEIQPYTGDTDIFIYPGYTFKCVDRLITNFHLPESSLLMLVCAFAGYQQIMNVYQQAINNAYRFYSYGDAMLLDRRENNKS